MAKKVRELTARDKVGLAAYAVLGRDYLTEAFKCTHDIKNARPESIYSMQSRWINGKQEKEFIESIRQQYTDILMQNIAEDAELTDKQLSTIIQRGIVAEKDLKKQSDMSLKLMQWRKDAKAEQAADERRKFVLSWKSICRTCQLMALYKATLESKGLSKAEFDESISIEPRKMIADSRSAQQAARERIINHKKESGDDKTSEALGWIFSNLGITVTDCYDILDFLKRQKEGKSDSVPHWMNR